MIPRTRDGVVKVFLLIRVGGAIYLPTAQRFSCYSSATRMFASGRTRDGVGTDSGWSDPPRANSSNRRGRLLQERKKDGGRICLHPHPASPDQLRPPLIPYLSLGFFTTVIVNDDGYCLE